MTLGDGTVVSLRQPTYCIDGPQVRPAAPADDAVAARRAADDRRSACSRPSPRSRSARTPTPTTRTATASRGAQTRSGPSCEQPAGARPLRLEGRQVPSIRRAGGAARSPAIWALQSGGARTLGRLHARRRRSASTHPTATARATAALRWRRSCSTSSCSTRRTSPCRRAAISTMPRSPSGKALFYALAARAATRPRSPPARWRASRSSATRRSGPTPTCCCTTWARASPTTAPKAWRTGANGARRRCGASASRRLVNGHTLFLHDGRARNLEEAILWHGGEAQAARDGFAALSQSEREALLAFVASL